MADNLEMANKHLDLGGNCYDVKKAMEAKKKTFKLLEKHWFDLWW